jgi:hypothetical protein
MSSSGSFRLFFSTKSYMQSSSPRSVLHPPWRDNYIWRRAQFMKLLIMQFCPGLFGPDILLSTLFSNTFSLCVLPLMSRDQVSLPYKTTGKSLVLYIVIVMLPPHTAEHSPRGLESGCVDSVLALARRMFGIRAECERRCV